MAADWEKILSYRRRLATELATLGEAAKANDATTIRRLGVMKRHVHEKLSQLAALDGFNECGKAGKSTSRPFFVPRLPKPRVKRA
jgi:hypothetical protein